MIYTGNDTPYAKAQNKEKTPVSAATLDTGVSSKINIADYITTAVRSETTLNIMRRIVENDAIPDDVIVSLFTSILGGEEL